MSISRSLLKSIIYDQHEVIKGSNITPRNYEFEANGNYVLTGLRRAGKSTLLYKVAKDLVASGISWNQIIYINFEDERLSEFNVSDFNEILSVQSELSNDKGYFFFDEIQNIDGWEKFARRMADSDERVYITGSNAKMLSADIEQRLGGRYFSKFVSTYNFDEYLTALNIPHDASDFSKTKAVGRIQGAFLDYYTFGGFPESLLYSSKREYVSNVYQKILLGDIVARNNIRNADSLRIMVKKIAEAVCSPISYTRIHSTINSIGHKISKDTIIDYVDYVKTAFLLFDIKNYYAKIVDKESNPKYYFRDNGLLNLFLDDKKSMLLENIVAISLYNAYKEDLYYLQSTKTGIDVDFYIPSAKTAIQVAYEISDTAAKREAQALIDLHKKMPEVKRFVIVTYEADEIISAGDIKIEVIPAYRFCMK